MMNRLPKTIGSQALHLGRDFLRNADNRVLSIRMVRVFKHCLTAQSTQTYAVCEIILVDSGFSDGSVSLVKENFPVVKVVELAKQKFYRCVEPKLYSGTISPNDKG